MPVPDATRPQHVPRTDPAASPQGSSQAAPGPAPRRAPPCALESICSDVSNQNFPTFLSQGGFEFTYLPKQQLANKAAWVWSKVSANNCFCFFFSQLKRGKSAFPPMLSPNSTQSKPNTKAHCSVTKEKNPLVFQFV